MRELACLVAPALDSLIAAPTREDPTGSVFQFEGDHADPLLREYPEMVPTHLRPALGIEDAPHRRFDTVVEGRVSCQIGVELGVPDAYSHLLNAVAGPVRRCATPGSQWTAGPSRAVALVAWTRMADASPPQTVYPNLKYADPKAAVEFLAETFGFERARGRPVRHAQPARAARHQPRVVRLGAGRHA
ncbi:MULTISPECIES: hypothetical protein [Amycolatopsis]|uniref:hypothetical protein n=1 Tax=Amycolatopsis TaxID=1813 RepID=UPI000B198483|nr:MULTISPECIES: hypothetical protein [Amycolatopsis]